MTSRAKNTSKKLIRSARSQARPAMPNLSKPGQRATPNIPAISAAKAVRRSEVPAEPETSHADRNYESSATADATPRFASYANFPNYEIGSTHMTRSTRSDPDQAPSPYVALQQRQPAETVECNRYQTQIGSHLEYGTTYTSNLHDGQHYGFDPVNMMDGLAEPVISYLNSNAYPTTHGAMSNNPYVYTNTQMMTAPSAAPEESESNCQNCTGADQDLLDSILEIDNDVYEKCFDCGKIIESEHVAVPRCSAHRMQHARPSMN